MCALGDAISLPTCSTKRTGWSFKREREHMKLEGKSGRGGDHWRGGVEYGLYPNTLHGCLRFSKYFLKAWGKGGKQKVMFELKV